MRIAIPHRLFGRVWRPPVQPDRARMRAMYHTALPTPPDAYDVDAALGVPIPPRMYLNDVEGDCVIAARANQQTRFVVACTGRVPNISDMEVEAEYRAETGGPDTGLVPEDSFALWQRAGWVADGANHKITAWGRVDATDPLDVKRAVWLLGGMQLSLSLPTAWSVALDAGKPWDVPADMSRADAQPNGWGGHQVYVVAYNPIGVICYTWGQRQLITWEGLDVYGAEKNMGEAAAIVRSNDGILAPRDGMVDIETLTADLRAIAG